MNQAVKQSALTLIAAAVLCAIAAVAGAHGGNDDLNVVHACIGGNSKTVRIVGVSGSCRPAETPAHWDIQGAPGSDGANGTNGIDGTSVTFVDYFSGSAGGCINGGVIYAAGNPPVNAYVCNGANGNDGEDGEDGVDATRADGMCFDPTNRYVDCGNGTVTDTVTGLIWLKQWNCLPNSTWAAANQAAAGLKNGDCGLADNSSAGDWRLPTKDEWRATIAEAVSRGCHHFGAGGPPSLTNDAGTACYGTGAGSSFAGVSSHILWSSSSDSFSPSIAWHTEFKFGAVSDGKVGHKNSSLGVWPVRGGTR